MTTPDLLHDLLTAAGPSGHEVCPARVWRKGCSQFSADVGVDHLGSSWARVPGTAGGLTLAVVGHIDEIGIHVTFIDDDGYVRFDQIGAWDRIQLVGQRVRLSTRGGTVSGVIGRKPIHLMSPEDRKKVPELTDLHIDIGARDADEARSMVRIGDAGVVDVQPMELPNGRIASRAIDDRVGCFVAAEVARLVADEGGAPGDLLALAVVQEETVFGGSQTSAFRHRPDVAIVIDVTHASDQPGVKLGPINRHTLGSGPVVARGTTLNPRVFERLYDAAEAEGIAFTIESKGREVDNDADAMHISRAGIPTGLVSVPLRYMHSPVELVELVDIEATARLIAAFAQRLEPGASFQR